MIEKTDEVIETDVMEMFELTELETRLEMCEYGFVCECINYNWNGTECLEYGNCYCL